VPTVCDIDSACRQKAPAGGEAEATLVEAEWLPVVAGWVLVEAELPQAPRAIAQASDSGPGGPALACAARTATRMATACAARTATDCARTATRGWDGGVHC